MEARAVETMESIALSDALPLDRRALCGRTPISGDAPAGASIRYEPEFLALQEEVARQESEGPLAVDWRRVVRDGCELLATRSKDLLLCTYVTLGLTRSEGYGGLALGLSITADVAEAFWAEMEPPARRERARVQMLEWIVARVVPVLTALPPEPRDAPALAAAAAALARLDTVAAERLQKESVAFGELTRLLRERSQSLPRPAAPAITPLPPPPSPPPAPPEPAQAAAPPPAPPAPAPVPPVLAAPPPVAAPASVADVEVALGRLQQSTLDVARGVLAANDADPRAYALLRQGLWCTVVQPPMSDAGVTPLPAPQPARLAEVGAMQSAGLHHEAVALIEQTLASAPFWLDGHRLCCLSLDALGASHAAAGLAVVGSLLAQLRRLPALLELSFSDRTPFANDATRQWLAGLAGPSAGEAAEAAEAPDAAGARLARRLAMAGKLADALALLADGAASARSERERARWQLQQAALCLENARPDMTLALLAHLEAKVAEFGLERWEPDIALRVSELSYDAMLHPGSRVLTTDESRMDTMRHQLERLCRVDIRSAAARVLER